MSDKVTYAELIEALSRDADFSKQKSEAFAKALIGRIKKELEESGKASITNFGSFKVKEIAERQGQNPRTGEPITIPAHNRVSFTPYKALKEKVNAKYAHLESELIGEKADDAESSEKVEQDKEPKEQSFFEREKAMEETKQSSETIFQFDDEAASEENDSEPEEIEAAEETKSENPFAFDEPDEEPEPELNVKPELEPEEGAEPKEEFVFEESDDEETVTEDEEGGNMALILSLAAILAVALVSVWWFFLRSETDSYTSQTVNVEQPSVTQPNTAAENNATEMDEATTYEAQTNTESMAGAGTSERESVEEAAGAASESGATVYEVSQNEWFWVIAEKVYGMSRFWPLIYQENFTLETHPDSLTNNSRLQIPELEGTAESPSKNDYLRLAEASMMVSEAYQNFGRTDKAEEYAKFAKKWERLGSE